MIGFTATCEVPIVVGMRVMALSFIDGTGTRHPQRRGLVVTSVRRVEGLRPHLRLTAENPQTGETVEACVRCFRAESDGAVC